METIELEIIDVVEVFDIEDDLENTEGHFRSCHYHCAIQGVAPGTIIEANCGKLYRTSGRVMRILTSKCGDCIKGIGTKPCLICGKEAIT